MHWDRAKLLTLPCLGGVFAFGTTNLALAAIYFVLFGGMVIGSWLTERLASRRCLSVSPYEPISCRISSVGWWCWVVIAVIVQLLLAWAAIVTISNFHLIMDWRSSGAPHLVGEWICMPLLEIALLTQVVLSVLHARWGWWRPLQMDAAGILMPSLSKAPLAWHEIVEMKLVCTASFPQLQVRLRRPLDQDQQVQRGWRKTWSADGMEARLPLYGRAYGAAALSDAIMQRWRAFGLASDYAMSKREMPLGSSMPGNQAIMAH
jgi:hypothetical protein